MRNRIKGTDVEQEVKTRFYFIDGLRGLALVSMVLFHFLYDVFIVYGFDSAWAERPSIVFWQQLTCWVFILTAGVSWHFGKNHWKRGIFLNLCGLVITAITLLFIPSQQTWFGILNFIGCAILLMIPLESTLRKADPRLGLLVSLLCFAFTRNIQNHYLGLGSWELIAVPQWIYDAKLFTAFGAPFPGFTSSDYFPLMPWFFLFCAGYFLWFLLAEKDKCREFFKRKIPLFSRVGKNTLWIYLIHQPLCMLILHLYFTLA